MSYENALEIVWRLEEARALARERGGMLGAIDEQLAAARTEACGALLRASREARDSGRHAEALVLVKLYAEQEHLALRAREVQA